MGNVTFPVCQIHEDYLHPVQKRMIASVPGVIKTSLRDFVEPEAYLQQYAQQVLKVPVTPVAKAALPSLFGKNLPAERSALLSFFQSHAVNINVRIEVSNLVCDAILMKFSARLGNRNVVVLAGADWQGVEYYDANRGFDAIANPFANLFPAGGGEKPKNFGQWFMQGGLETGTRLPKAPNRLSPSSANSLPAPSLWAMPKNMVNTWMSSTGAASGGI